MTAAAIAAAILAAEGPHHIEGRYVADLHLAERLRQQAAERRARDLARAAAHRSRTVTEG